MSEGYIKGKDRTWYDVCKECSRIVSPRHSCCPNCGGTEYESTIVKNGAFIWKYRANEKKTVRDETK